MFTARIFSGCFPSILSLERIINALTDIIGVRFKRVGKIYYFSPGDEKYDIGDRVIVETARGVEMTEVVLANRQIDETELSQPLRSVIRRATPDDFRVVEENARRAVDAFEICKKKIAAHKLDMKLIEAEYTFDGTKILFYFAAEGRVDFRELVRDLASVFRMRIELRQIGVRDEAKLFGGLGICGRPLCCATFLDDFQPVSIKMAKEQNLSLNPTKISGTCGRLMCCLKYEQEAYEDLLRTSPKNESFVDTVDGRGTVVDVNLLRQTVRVRMEDQPDQVNCYHNCDICVLRNGKAKKNDPPIPKEIAPISSKPRPAKKVEMLPDEPLPEVIITGRDMPPVTPEPEWEPEETPEEEKPEGARAANRRRRRKKPAAPAQDAAPRQEGGEKPQRPKAEKPRQEKPRPQGQPKQPKAPKPEAAQETPKPETAKSANHRRRRRRPHTGPKPEGKE